MTDTVEPSLLHILVFIVVGGAVLLVSIAITNIRVRSRRKRLARLESEVNEGLAPRMRSVVYEHVEKSYHTKIQPSPLDSGIRGWDISGGVGKDVHFREEVSRSWRKVEKAVLSRYPSLHRPDHVTIREYIEFLSDRFAGLSRSACLRYISLYESARFGRGEFTVEERETYRRAIAAIMGFFDVDIMP